MATRRPIVQVGGTLSELPAGDVSPVPSLSVTPGDVTPDPGAYTVVWSPTVNALCWWDVDPGVWRSLVELPYVVVQPGTATTPPPGLKPALAWSNGGDPEEDPPGTVSGLVFWDQTRWRRITALEVLNGDPVDPGYGNLTVNPVTGTMRVWNGTAWVSVGGGASAGPSLGLVLSIMTRSL